MTKWFISSFGKSVSQNSIDVRRFSWLTVRVNIVYIVWKEYLLRRIYIDIIIFSNVYVVLIEYYLRQQAPYTSIRKIQPTEPLNANLSIVSAPRINQTTRTCPATNISIHPTSWMPIQSSALSHRTSVGSANRREHDGFTVST